jgi:hypothetical protein
MHDSHGALHGDHRTAGNTITTVQETLSLFFQQDIRHCCIPQSEPARHQPHRHPPAQRLKATRISRGHLAASQSRRLAGRWAKDPD